jgi:hypothetical protein
MLRNMVTGDNTAAEIWPDSLSQPAQRPRVEGPGPGQPELAELGTDHVFMHLDHPAPCGFYPQISASPNEAPPHPFLNSRRKLIHRSVESEFIAPGKLPESQTLPGLYN